MDQLRVRMFKSSFSDETGMLSKNLSMSDNTLSRAGRDTRINHLVKPVHKHSFLGFKDIRPRRGSLPNEDEENLGHFSPHIPVSYNHSRVEPPKFNRQRRHSVCVITERDRNSNFWEDFFKPMASGCSLKAGFHAGVDLDAIPLGSTENLANTHAYHKLSVKPEKASSQKPTTNVPEVNPLLSWKF